MSSPKPCYRSSPSTVWEAERLPRTRAESSNAVSAHADHTAIVPNGTLRLSGEPLDAMIVSIGHIECAVGIHGNAAGMMKLTGV